MGTQATKGTKKLTKLQETGRHISALTPKLARSIVEETGLAPKPIASIGHNSVEVFKDIMTLQPLARGEYDLSDKEAEVMRRRLYSINKNNAVGARWRTMREGRLLVVWRIW